MRYFFNIPIGDWSGDGHGKCEYVRASATKPIEDVREAYFAAKEKYPDLCPENYCNEYEEYTINESIYNKLISLGAISPSSINKYGGSIIFSIEQITAVIIWFINLGDDTLDVMIEPNIPMLNFYGADKKKRHIGSFGYGLFE